MTGVNNISIIFDFSESNFNCILKSTPLPIDQVGLCTPFCSIKWVPTVPTTKWACTPQLLVSTKWLHTPSDVLMLNECSMCYWKGLATHFVVSTQTYVVCFWQPPPIDSSAPAWKKVARKSKIYLFVTMTYRC